MAALRERHFACDGMGHADRPWLHNAFGLDAQPRGVCLSVAERRYSHSHAHSNSDTDSNANANGNSHCDGNANTQADADPEACSYAKAEANTASTRIASINKDW